MQVTADMVATPPVRTRPRIERAMDTLTTPLACRTFLRAAQELGRCELPHRWEQGTLVELQQLCRVAMCELLDEGSPHPAMGDFMPGQL
jgi:hypothetical protein